MPSTRRTISRFFSCFNGSKVSDIDETGDVGAPFSRRRPSSWFSRSPVRKMKKFATATKIDGSTKAKEKCRRSKTSSTKKHRRSEISTESLSHHSAARCSSRHEPAPLFCVPDNERTGTTKLHSGVPASPPPPSYNSSKNRRDITMKFDRDSTGLTALLVSLAATVIFSRACAILIVCLWFYVSSTRRTSQVTEDKHLGVDTNSPEYKKKVMLEGLLDRGSKQFNGSKTRHGAR